MARPARLITPRGKIIDLPDEVYRQVKALLASKTRRRSRAEVDKAIRSAYGKYAGRTSLTQALLADRAADRAREQAKLARLHG
jgi:hypothetical protein